MGAENAFKLGQNKYQLYKNCAKIPLIFPEGEGIMQRVHEDWKRTGAEGASDTCE